MSRQKFENSVFYDTVPGYEKVMEIQIIFLHYFGPMEYSHMQLLVPNLFFQNMRKSFSYATVGYIVFFYHSHALYDYNLQQN